ncbi:MAG: hypothetical protein AB7V62_05260 [Thermoleophilia bacterium]
MRRRGPAAAVAVVLLAAPAAGQAAIPASGTIVEGSGPAAAPVGSSGAAAAARLGVACLPALSRRARVSWCGRGGATFEVDAAGRIASWRFTAPAADGWRTRAGLGPGGSLAAARARLRGRATVTRAAGSVSYTTRRTVRGAVRVTVVTGRERAGRIARVVVAVRPRRILAAAPSGPAPGLRVALRDFAPREPVRISARAPWQRPVHAVVVGTPRAGLGGRGALVVPAGAGPLARVLALRPAGTPSPVRLLVTARGARTAAVLVPLPPPPTIAPVAGTVAEDAPGGVVVTGGETGADYRVDASWSCPAGPPGALEDVSDAVVVRRPGPVTVPLTVAYDQAGIFGPACRGAAAPAPAEVTLTLVRRGRTAAGADSPEAVARTTVVVAPSP